MGLRSRLALLVCGVLGTLAFAQPATAETLFAVTEGDQLISFDSGSPGTIQNSVPINGTGAGEFVAALYRDLLGRTGIITHAGNNQLRTYDVNPSTGQATGLPGNSGTVPPGIFGVGVDPTDGTLRFVSDQGNNLRIDTTNGNLLGADPNLPPGIGAIGFTNNFNGATSTSLYGINHQDDQLGLINPATGQLTPIGPLGVNAQQDFMGFDVAPDGTAFAALVVNNTSGLYTIDLSTGAATQVGQIGNNLVVKGLALTPGAQPPGGGGGDGGSAVAPEVVTGSLGAFRPAGVGVFDAANGVWTLEIADKEIGSGFRGGVWVSLCDLNGTGVDEVVAGAQAHPNGGGKVVTVDPATGLPASSFSPFGPGFHDGVRVACGDVDGDGFSDIITAPGPGGGPRVRVFDGETGARIGQFFAFDRDFRGGVSVAAGDVNGDGRAEILTGTGTWTTAANVRWYELGQSQPAQSLFPYGRKFTGGVFVAAGDVTGDGAAEIVVAPGTGTRKPVTVYGSAGQQLGSFRGAPNRWGDYSAMSVDPQSDTFWFAEGGGRQVVNVNAAGERVGSFKAYGRGFDGGSSLAVGNFR